MSVSKEILYHFKCIFCKKWWTIGDAHVGGDGSSGSAVNAVQNQVWYCPWCGKKQPVAEQPDVPEMRSNMA